MSLIDYLTLFASIANFILGVVVLLHNGKKVNPLEISFSIFSFLTTIWVYTNFHFALTHDNLFVFKSQYATGGLVLFSALIWIEYLIETKISWKKFFIILLGGIIIFITPYIDGIIIKNISFTSDTNYVFETGKLFGLYGFILLLTLLYLLFRVLFAYLKKTGVQKTQIGYVLTGLSLFATVTILFGLILPFLGFTQVVPFDSQSSLIWIVFATYAITKHHLFNIKVIATEILTALMAIMLLVRIPLSKTPGELAFNLVFFHIFLVLGILLIRTVWQEIHRAQEVENLNKEKIGAYDKIANQAHNLQLLQKISDIILKSFGEKLPNLTQKVLNIAAKDISYCSTILIGLITEDKKYLQAYNLSENKFSTFILNHLDRPFQEHQIAIEGSESNLFLQSHLNKKLIAGNKFVDFVNPPVPRAIAELIQKALGIKSVVSFPVLKGNESVGIMGFMLNKPKEKITEEDYHLLKAMADEISLAIEKTTVYKELEQKIEDLKQINVDLQKLLDMKTEFMRVASHQLRTPISSVKGILSMLNEDGLPPEKREEFIKLAYESADKLSSIIKDILSATSLEAGRLDLQFQKTNITKVLEESVKEHGLLVAGKPVKLNYKPPIDIPEIQADPYWMKEVFNNLIDNAIFYTPKGEVNIGVANQPANVAVTIQDTGVGITPEDKERLFNKFTRGQNAMSVHPNGSGLGLYIAKNIIDLHQGNINIESTGKDKGTTIKVELPK